MYIIQTILGELRSRFQAKQLSHEVLPAPKDIDVFVDRLYRTGIEPYLKDRGFVRTGSSTSNLVFRQYVGGELYILDLLFDFNYLNDVFGSLAFSPAFTDAVLSDRSLEKFVRYVFLLRNGAEARAFVERYADSYIAVITDPYYVRPNIFKKPPTADVLLRIMRKDPVALLSYLRFSHVRRLGAHYLRSWGRRMRSGRIVAVVGPDGSGKTTLIDHLLANDSMKRMYMGDWGFTLQPFYTFLHRQHIAIARLSYPFYYIENWFRYLKAHWWKLQGYTVLVDRYPGLNRHLRKQNVLLRLNDWMYRLFPSADAYILLSAPPQVIHARKPELSIEEIATAQEETRKRLAGKRYIEIASEKLDDTLNAALQFLSEGA